jgi:predicted enzyme related to lactoylglutathione lyase
LPIEPFARSAYEGRMPNAEGTPIWYELMTKDPAASKTFYEEVIGWNVQPPRPGDAMNYREIETGHGAVGGVLPLTDAMCENGARPTWLFYLGVNDVDATVKKVLAAGGRVLMDPFDVPEVGRIAMIADPQGIPLYVMRGSSNEESKAFEPTGMGKCNWNELSTPDVAGAHAFYAKVFGFTFPDKMPMPHGGDYTFVAAGNVTFGGTMAQPPGAPPGWTFYFRAPDIEAAAAKIVKAGGKVHAGPMDVPGGDQVVVASDPHGVAFGVSAPGKTK